MNQKKKTRRLLKLNNPSLKDVLEKTGDRDLSDHLKAALKVFPMAKIAKLIMSLEPRKNSLPHAREDITQQTMDFNKTPRKN